MGKDLQKHHSPPVLLLTVSQPSPFPCAGDAGRRAVLLSPRAEHSAGVQLREETSPSLATSTQHQLARAEAQVQVQEKDKP